jgi:two-component system, OmpR family, response regulator
MSNVHEVSRELEKAVAPGNILVLDDDPAMLDMMTNYFEEHNVPLTALRERTGLARHLATSEPSLVLLDLRLGKDDGFDVLRDIRSHSDVPVIIITGHRLDEADRIVGLELGADDYIVKPFSLRELFARIRAVLRRHEMGRTARYRSPERGGYRFGRWKLERRGRRLSDQNGSPVPLCKSEYAILLAFLESPHRALTREYLQHATRLHEDILDRSIDVQVMRLRRKLEADPSAPKMILTERGLGYSFAAAVEPF